MSEHRWLMEQSIGRKLRSDEHVHHINGDKSDNRLENLELLDRSEHLRYHRAMGHGGKPKFPPIECARCHRLRRHGAHGLCDSCATTVGLEARKAADPEATRAHRSEIARRAHEKRKASGKARAAAIRNNERERAKRQAAKAAALQREAETGMRACGACLRPKPVSEYKYRVGGRCAECRESGRPILNVSSTRRRAAA